MNFIIPNIYLNIEYINVMNVMKNSTYFSCIVMDNRTRMIQNIAFP